MEHVGLLEPEMKSAVENPAGRISVIETPVAAEGPALLAVSVKSSVLPLSTVAGAFFIMETSAEGVTGRQVTVVETRLLVLSVVSWSFSSEVITASLRRIVPHCTFEVTSNAIVKVRFCPAMYVIEPLQTIVPNGSAVVISRTQFPEEAPALNVRPAAGTASFTTTFVAVSEPEFVVVRM